MMKRLIHLSIIFLFITMVFGQAFRLTKPTLDDPDNIYEGLASNGVTQIVPQGDSLIWIATGGGLSRTSDFGETFWHYSGENNLPRGGISAIDTLGSLIWVAGVFDSTTNKGTFQTGGGLAYSKDYGSTWTFIPQPVDTTSNNYKLQIMHGDTVSFYAVKTPISNTTWDISIAKNGSDTIVYIASWAGGIRRSRDFGTSWESIPLPNDQTDMLLSSDKIDYNIDPRDPPIGNHNHKGFSVIAYDSTIWIGTAGGVNRGTIEYDGGLTWRKYNAQNSNLSGNFILSIARHFWQGKETIWVAALTAEGAGEVRAACKTSDGGLTWFRTLVGERIYNFAFDDSVVYVCTDRGLFKSIDGENWALYEPVQDNVQHEYLFSHDVYGALADHREGQLYLWVGTADGIAKTPDDGMNWMIYRSSVSTKIPGQPEIYAYPNPFSPTHHNLLNRDGHVRVKYHVDGAAKVWLEVYDFSMELVFKGEKHVIESAGEYPEVWDGRNKNGVQVANGTYFCKLTQEINGHENSFWTKLIVVK